MPKARADDLPLLQVDPALLRHRTASTQAGQESSAASAPVSSTTLPNTAAGGATEPVSTPIADTPATTQTTAEQLTGSPNQPRSPTTIEADTMQGENDVEMRADGNVVLKRDKKVLKTDHLRYNELTDEAEATGNVFLQVPRTTVRSPHGKLFVAAQEGQFDTPNYELDRIKKSVVPGQGNIILHGGGQAQSLLLEGENQYRLRQATYSTCPAPRPDWYVRVDDLHLDMDRGEATGKNGSIFFKGVPLAYSPWLSFPLNEQRQSGFLSPTLGTRSNTGLDITVPYYFNIAPNYDATFSPRWIGRRGVLLGGEARYLNTNIQTTVQGEWLPRDEVLGASRGTIAFDHNQSFNNGIGMHLVYNEVSDPDYFSDLSGHITQTSQTNLLQMATFSYGNGSWFSSQLNLQKYQTLQGLAPYARLPQVTANVSFPDLRGTSFSMPMEYVDFSHPTLVEGRRSVMYPQLSYEWRTPAIYVTPKVGVHISQYEVDRNDNPSIRRVIPTFTLDSGVTFERETTIGKQNYIQTLEPRLFYVKVPYRDQNDIPIFDSGESDFSFAQLFSENIFSGSDRIADANQLTLALASRFIRADNGTEVFRALVGQRFYFADQRVTLPGGTPRTGTIADYLMSVSGQVYQRLFIDTSLQYDPRASQIQRASAGVRYQPDFAKSLAASLRYKANEFRDLDISGQWPLFGRWYGVGRYNRNLKDHRLTESILGAEYKGDCWVFRAVAQSLLTTAEKRTSAFFFQLELNGLASIGSSPMQILKRNISGYSKINEQESPSDFVN